MNINNYAPKHVVLDQVKAQAKQYEGTFEELVGLIKAKDVVLTTTADGTVNGFWIESHCDNLMLDQLSGHNFSAAYASKPIMEWIDSIYSDLAAGVEPYDHHAVQVQEVEEETDDDMQCCSQGEEDGLIIPISELPFPGHSLAHRVRMYLRKNYHKCLSKGNPPTIVREGANVRVTNLTWGRDLCNAEIERYGY